MDAKEYLEQARYLDMRITAKLAQLDELHHLMLQAGGSDSITAKIMTLQEETDRDVDELVALKKEIMAMIRQVSRPEYRTVLELRYLSFWSWKKIAVNMNYHRKYIYVLHRAALKKISEIRKDLTKPDHMLPGLSDTIQVTAESMDTDQQAAGRAAGRLQQYCVR